MRGANMDLRIRSLNPAGGAGAHAAYYPYSYGNAVRLPVGKRVQ